MVDHGPPSSSSIAAGGTSLAWRSERVSDRSATDLPGLCEAFTADDKSKVENRRIVENGLLKLD